MTDLAQFPVASGETVTAFALGPLEAWRFNGTETAAADNVDYKFINGFVDVGDLPCRVATWNEVRNRSTPQLDPFDTVATNLPGANRRLDFSGFWHLPHRLSRWCKTRLVPETAGDHPFRVSTCGGVNIWVDGVHVVAHEPFARNTAHDVDVLLPLAADGSDVVILLEDMAERDTSFFLELTWLGSGALMTLLKTSADAQELENLMRIAREVRPKKVVFCKSDDLVLMFDTPLDAAVTIDAAVHQSVHLSHKPPRFKSTVVAPKGATQVSLGSLADLNDAYHPLKLTLSIGDSRVHQYIGFALLSDQSPRDLGDDIEARKATALQFAATKGELRTGRLLAALASGRPFDEALQDILDDTLQGINDRRDCSDFVMVPLLWAYGAYRDQFPTDAANRIEQAILNYRYWMTEPGNDAMWFWSENHVLCFHVSEYIAGGLMPDAVFGGSGLTGAEHRQLATERLGKWFASIEGHGLAEWNSAAYYPVDFIGLLALYHWGEGDIKSRATLILDRLFAMIALHNIGGVSAGTMGRAYDKELRAGPLTELTPFAAVAFGRGWLNDGVASLPMLCICDYQPPRHLSDWAAVPTGQALSAQYVQGFDTAARLSLYKTAHVQLSASVDGAPGHKGHQQHLVDVQCAGAPFARAWINHPGDDDPWGGNRPSYWAGNGTMPRVGMEASRCLLLSDLGAAPRIGFTHAYAPVDQFDDAVVGDDFIALRSGAAGVILKASGPIVPVTDGPGQGIEYRCFGTSTGWAVTVCDLADDQMQTLVTRAKGQNLTLDAAAQQLTLTETGQPSLMLDYRRGLYRDQKHVLFSTASLEPQVTVRAIDTPV